MSPWAYATHSSYEEAVESLRDAGISTLILTGRNPFGRECTASFQEDGQVGANGFPISVHFHISVDELDGGENPALATLRFSIFDNAQVTSILSAPGNFKLEAEEMRATPPRGVRKKFQFSVAVVDHVSRGMREVRLSENGRLFTCLIPTVF
jgi:hypothetical protein